MGFECPKCPMCTPAVLSQQNCSMRRSQDPKYAQKSFSAAGRFWVKSTTLPKPSNRLMEYFIFISHPSIFYESSPWALNTASPFVSHGHFCHAAPLYSWRQLSGSYICNAVVVCVLQSTYGGYVYSYAVKSIANLNKTEGAYLNALFWVRSFGLLAPLFNRQSRANAFILDTLRQPASVNQSINQCV